MYYVYDINLQSDMWISHGYKMDNTMREVMRHKTLYCAATVHGLSGSMFPTYCNLQGLGLSIMYTEDLIGMG